MKDLIVLVADLDAEQSLQNILERHHAFQIRPITFDIYRHPMRDVGCCREAADFLRPFVDQYRYALVIFDHHGSGRDQDSTTAIQDSLEAQLVKNGWAEPDKAARVIVIAPELEIWVWSVSAQVDQCLGWAEQQPDLRSWLRSEGLLKEKASKPDDPKEAMIRALRKVKKRFTARVFAELSQKVSWRLCTDQQFTRLRDTLVEWFAQ